MKNVLLALLLCVSSLPALATSITGKLAVAGLNTYSTTGVTFVNPGTVLLASGDFAALDTPPTINLTSFSFASAAGTMLFNQDGISATILSFAVEKDTANFLNASGVVQVIEAGFAPTDFAFTLVSTRPDGTTSYTADVVGLAAVPEPGTLVLVGSGLLFLFFCGRQWGKRRPSCMELIR